MAKPKTDRSRAHISSVRGSKSSRPSGVESSTGGGSKGMAKRPKGRPIKAPGGRNSRV